MRRNAGLPNVDAGRAARLPRARPADAPRAPDPDGLGRHPGGGADLRQARARPAREDRAARGRRGGPRRLVGTDEERIVGAGSALLSARRAPRRRAGPSIPTATGSRRERIAAILTGRPFDPFAAGSRMRPDWESGLRGRIYALGRRLTPLSWRRALRRRRPHRAAARHPQAPGRARALRLRPGPRPSRPPPTSWCCRSSPGRYRRQRPQQLAEALARRGRRVFYGSVEGSGEPREAAGVAPGVTLLPIEGVRREDPADRRLQGRRPRGRSARASSAARDAVRARGRRPARRVALLGAAGRGAARALRLAHRLRLPRRARRVRDESRRHPRRGRAERRPRTPTSSSRPPSPSGAGWRPGTPARAFCPTPATSRCSPRSRPPRRRPAGCTVGYVGAVDDWFDMELLAGLARLRPTWRFEIVGGLEDATLAAPAPAEPRLPRRAPAPGDARLPRAVRRRDHPVPPLAADPRHRPREALRGGGRRTDVVVARPWSRSSPSRAGASCASPRRPRSSRARSRRPPPRGAARRARQRAFARGEHLGHPRRRRSTAG